MFGKETFTLSSRAVNMRSVHTDGSTQLHRALISSACIALSGTPTEVASLCMIFTPPPPCTPWLHAHYRHFIATMGAVTPARLSIPRRSPRFTCPAFPTIPTPTTPCPSDAAFTRYPSARPISCFQVKALPLNRGLAGYTRPNRVCHPSDWSFTSCCFPPRLAATQLHSVTGRRAYA
ncbi:MAG: hypothetical protein NTZ78_08400 [Candidatus Aureabacteria bacterium]|nr:hypothetical protein [Candidatus Auribacterota bacterium]